LPDNQTHEKWVRACATAALPFLHNCPGTDSSVDKPTGLHGSEPSQDIVSCRFGLSTKCMRTKDDINFVSDSDSFRSKLVLPPLSRGKSATNPVARQRRRRLEALQRLPRQRRRKSRLGSTERRPNQLDSRRGHRAARGCAPHEIQPDPLATLCKSNPRHALILRAGTRTLSSEHAQRTGTRQAIEPR